jgi:starvation-inducible DNA-binding protein
MSPHPAPHRHPVDVALIAALADTYALAVKTHAAHWNVVGPAFFALHEAFEAQYRALLEAADAIAERLRARGVSAPAGLATLAASTGIADLETSRGEGICAALALDHRQVAGVARQALERAQADGDEVTVDLLVERIAAHDHTAWMLQAQAG